MALLGERCQAEPDSSADGAGYRCAIERLHPDLCSRPRQFGGKAVKAVWAWVRGWGQVRIFSMANVQSMHA